MTTPTTTHYELRRPYPNKEWLEMLRRNDSPAPFRRPSAESVLHHRGRWDQVLYFKSREEAEMVMRFNAEREEEDFSRSESEVLEAPLATVYERGGDPIKDAWAVLRLVPASVTGEPVRHRRPYQPKPRPVVAPA